MMGTLKSFLKKEVVLLNTNSIFGRMTAFLLKQSPSLSKLTLYDDKNITISNDIEFINTACKVNFVNGIENMSEAIKTADIIIIGDDCVKETNHETVFSSRAAIISNYVQQIACHNSNAIIVVATTPVNMTVPLVAETLKSLGKWNEKKLFGMTNVENIRARCILANHLRTSPRKIDFPVIGGSSSETRVPLLSKICPFVQLNKPNIQKVTCAVKNTEAKLHSISGSPESLNRAYATSLLVQSIVAALNGQPVIETVLSYQNVINGTNYFSLPVVLGEEGIKKHIEFSNISQHEKYLLSYAIKCMASDAMKAKRYSDKIKENLIKISPQTKLNSLKRHKEEIIKVRMPQVQNIPEEKGISKSTNFEPSLKLLSADKEQQSVMNMRNSAIDSNECNINSHVFSNSIHTRPILPEDKVPFFVNEDITSEIDITLGINNVYPKCTAESMNTSKNPEKQTSEEIISNNLENNFKDLPQTVSIPSTPSTEVFTNSHCDIEEVKSHFKDKEMSIKCKCTKEHLSSENITIKTQKNIEELGYPSSVIPQQINKLTESTCTKNVSEATNYTTNSGLENYKSLKRYHKEVSNFERNSTNHIKKNIDNDIPLLDLHKEQMSSLPPYISNNPRICDVSACESIDSYFSKNDVKLKKSKEFFDKSQISKTGDLNNIGKLSNAEYLTLSNGKDVIPSWEMVHNFNFRTDNQKNMLVDFLEKLPKKTTDTQEIYDENSGQKTSLYLKTGSTLTKNDNSNLKNNYGLLEYFQTNSDEDAAKFVTEIPVSNNEKTLNNSHLNALNDGNTAGIKYTQQINKPHLILCSELFKSYRFESLKPLVKEWSRYVSSESHDKQIDSSNIINDHNNQKKMVSLLSKSEKDVDIHHKYAVNSTQKIIPNHQEVNSQESKSPQISVSSPKFGKRFNVHKPNELLNNKKSDKDPFFESVLCKQKNTFLSGLKYSSFSKESDFSFSAGKSISFSKSLRNNKESKTNNQHDLQKLHLLKTKSKSENMKVSSNIDSVSQPSSEVTKTFNWKKNFFKKDKKGTMIKPSTLDKTISKESPHNYKHNEVDYHRLKGKKEHSPIETKINEGIVNNNCPPNLSFDSGKDVNNNKLSPSNSELINQPFENMQKKALSDVGETKLKVNLPTGNDNNSCISPTNIDSDSQHSCISLGYVLPQPSCKSDNDTLNSDNNISNSESTENVRNQERTTDTFVQTNENDAIENYPSYSWQKKKNV